MPVKLENLTARPVLLVLSSGESLRLSPGETSAALHEVEIQNNPKVDKLMAQRVIAVRTDQPSEPENPTAGNDTTAGKAAAAQPKKPKSST